MEEEITPSQLTPRQEKFCVYFASDKEFFGNGTQSYIEAYDIDIREKGAYAGARSSAYRLLTNADILARINELLEVGVLNDEFVDKQLAFLITQSAEMAPKLGAIKEYNALKKRITQKVELSLGNTRDKIKDFLDDGHSETDGVPDNGSDADREDTEEV